MKHSNWILGLGILVAVLLIAGSLYLTAETHRQGQTTDIRQEIASPIESVTALSKESFLELTKRLTTTLLKN